MKYDIQRTIFLNSVFAAPRFAGTEGEATALDRMADELTMAGWKVADTTRHGRVQRIRLTNAFRAGAVAILLGSAAIALSRGHWSFPILLVVAIGIFINLALQVGFVPYSDRPKSIRTVEADAGVESKRPRVVILTRVATPRRWLGGSRRWKVMGLVAVLAVVVEILAGFQPVVWGRGGPFLAWIFLLIGLAILAFEPMPNMGGPGPDDNRTGLALLVELARIWPKSARDRVDVRFIVFGGPRETAVPSHEVDARSSLVIELVNPGLGSKIGLAGTVAELETAREAAHDLWIPYRTTLRELGSLPDRATPSPYLIVEGMRESQASDDPAALGRAAQLAIEIALRWGKRHPSENAVR